jgi:uncharacterized protein (TIGR02453 family)
MITRKTFAFLTALKGHNDRDWFQAHKSEYLEAKSEFEGLVGELIGRISAFDPAVKGLDPRKCIFRINRDTRFGKDKSPYKTNMGAHIGPSANKFHEHAGYYLHLEPGNSFLGGGSYMPSPAWLKAIRQAISEDGKFFRRILGAASFKKNFGEMEGEKLKTAPQGYGSDHPHIDLLRHKNFLAMHPLKDTEITAAAFGKEAASVFKALLPFNRFLNDVLEDAG